MTHAMCNIATSKARRIILLVESPLSERDAYRFGLESLTKSGLAVEVWDVGSITLPNAELQFTKRPSDVTVVVIQDLFELKARSSELSMNDMAVLIFGIYQGQFRRCGEVLKVMCASQVRLGGVIGRSPWNNFEPTLAYAQEWGLLRFRYLRIRTGIIEALVKFLRLMLGMPGMRALRRRHLGVRQLDYVWAATSLKPIDTIFIGNRTAIRFVHTFDFDLIRKANLGPSEGQFITYIDGLGPLHPDIVTLNLNLVIPTYDEYFGKLRAIFDWLEEATGLGVVIAAHPRAREGVLETLYGNREIAYASTAQTIAKSSLVLMSHPSDSVNFVVALGKPALVIQSDGDLRYERAGTNLLVNTLALDTVMVQSLPDSFTPPRVNEKAYSRFHHHHIKRRGSLDVAFWDAVANDAST